VKLQGNLPKTLTAEFFKREKRVLQLQKMIAEVLLWQQLLSM